LTILDDRAQQVTTVVFCAGQYDDVTAWAARAPAHVNVIHDHKAGIAHRYDINGTPFTVSVDREGRVAAKGIVNTEHGLISAADEAVTPARMIDPGQLGKVKQT